MFNPSYRPTNQQQAGLYYARRRRLARLIIQNLTPWSSGLIVTQGQYVQNIDNGYLALNSATTGTVPPTHTQGQASDGAVTWQLIDQPAFAQMIFSPPPTPA